MSIKFQAAILILLLLFSQTIGLAETKPLELKWNELSPMVVGQHVELTLTNGARVGGEAAVVREEAFVLDVRKSSDIEKYPKGSAAIPRDSVTLVKVVKSRGSWGRSMGTVIGVLSGVVIGAYAAIAGTDSSGKGIAVFLGIASATAVGGYFAGRGIDRRVTLIKVVP